jgi:hypothetical protein
MHPEMNRPGHTGSDRPVDLEGVPAQEDISTADAVERVDRDPEEQENREEGQDGRGPEIVVDEVPETDPAQEVATTSPPPEEPTGTSQWPAP